MANTTKQALEASLKRMMLKKPLAKITIRDITDDCGISRIAFYYHFKDIYDLIEWVCVEDATRALQGIKTCDTWQEGLLQIFEAVLENKPFVLNACRCISREQMERFLYNLTYGLIRGWWTKKAGAPPSPKRTRPSSPIFTSTALWASCWTGSSRACMTTTTRSPPAWV